MRHPRKKSSKVLKTVALGVAVGSGVALFGVRANEATSSDPVVVSQRPSLNFYGLPGGVDMPSAYAMADGTFVTSVSHFAGTTRTTFSFQATPRISASFRYIGIQDWNSESFDTYRDRSFDVRFLLNKESRLWPAVTVGLQDFAGTGIYAGEYVVASKSFDVPAIGQGNGALRVSAGLGWGRLGSSGSIGSPFGSDRPVFSPGDTGGELSADQWFRGPAAPFAGVEWQVNDKFGLKVEYSSDAYEQESEIRDVFSRSSRFNFGAEYQVSRELRLGAYYLYGSEFGISAQIQLNPHESLTPLRVSAPSPIIQRPSRAINPQAYDTGWATATTAPIVLRDALAQMLEKDGLVLISLSVSASEAELRFQNKRYNSMSIAIGRAARALAQAMPPSVETFRLVPMADSLALSSVTLRRSDLEQLEYAPDSHDALLARAGFGEASPELAGAVQSDIFPATHWSLSPYLALSYFDPDRPVRADVGLSLQGSYEPAPGWKVAGALRHRLAGNIGDSDRLSNSVLPRVRTDAVLYAQGGDTYIEELYAQRQWKAAPDVYARVTAGYLESMFGGVSAEVLWKPQDSRLALGVEANYVKKRDYDRLFGFQDYDVATGHLSAYYEFNNGYIGQIDAGRYLAGDVGATVTLTRVFSNGWQVGGFFTLTDVSAEDFGEGSFDKGISVTIPVNWFLGRPSQKTITETVRPIQRDGGARLVVPSRLYEEVRGGHQRAVQDQWSRVWD